MNNENNIEKIEEEIQFDNELQKNDIESNNFDFFEMSLDEYLDLESVIFEMIYEYLCCNVSKYSSQKFHDELLNEIANYFYEEWLIYELISEEDYDCVHDIIYVMIENFYDIYENEFPKRSYICSNIIKNINKNEITNMLEYIRNIDQPKQRTKEWYDFRQNIITASNVHKVLGSQTQINNFILEKSKPYVVKPINYYVKNSRQWGNIYEPLSIKIYEKLYHTKVEDFGCIQHQKYSFLGASPDGINVDINSDRYGRMIEVKNIYNRDITGIPKEDYWIQMQIQMETCNLDECDFIETRFKECENENDFYEDEKSEWKGVILCFVKKSMLDEKTPIYEYYPLYDQVNKNEIDMWIQSLTEKLGDTFQIYSKHYWYLDEFSCVLVKRNTKWFDVILPKIEEVWKMVEKEKEKVKERKIESNNNCKIIEIFNDEFPKNSDNLTLVMENDVKKVFI